MRDQSLGLRMRSHLLIGPLSSEPKSENATLTNFKTKTIHLPEQLKEDVTLPTNNRKHKGFSKEELTWLQSLRGVPHVIQTQLSPLLLYLTDLDQFLHHWDVTETVCHSLLVVPVRSQSFDVLQTAISKHLVGLTVIPDSTAGCVLGVICKLLDHTCVLSETLLPFLASCCYSLLYFLTLEKGEAEHLRKSKLQSHQMEPCDQCGLHLTPQPPSAFHASTQEFLNFLNAMDRAEVNEDLWRKDVCRSAHRTL
ncbi:testis-expressed protein 10-like [Bos javanicus]|uniref:testis-expressed protein 10-like n=1 Tax=Bos javanicus TaxID=9906 RepID=UPI002AA8AE36|nr:testis-expressed protein 10-like [Bos javanicus]